MRSWQHLLISTVVGLALVAFVVPSDPIETVLLIGWAAVVGTFIDLDHFVIARIRAGSWRSLRRCFRDPAIAFIRQDEIFEAGDVGSLTRLGSHLLLSGVLVGFLVPIAPTFALVTALVLALHVCTDVIWEVWRTGRLRFWTAISR